MHVIDRLRRIISEPWRPRDSRATNEAGRVSERGRGSPRILNAADPSLCWAKSKIDGEKKGALHSGRAD